MSATGLLDRLAARLHGEADLIQPRVPSLFEEPARRDGERRSPGLAPIQSAAPAAGRPAVPPAPADQAAGAAGQEGGRPRRADASPSPGAARGRAAAQSTASIIGAASGDGEKGRIGAAVPASLEMAAALAGRQPGDAGPQPSPRPREAGDDLDAAAEDRSPRPDEPTPPTVLPPLPQLLERLRTVARRQQRSAPSPFDGALPPAGDPTRTAQTDDAAQPAGATPAQPQANAIAAVAGPTGRRRAGDPAGDGTDPVSRPPAARLDAADRLDRATLDRLLRQRGAPGDDSISGDPATAGRPNREPVVQVRIGRLEVQAPPAPRPEPAVHRPPRRAAGPRMSLSDYLAARNEGRL